MSNQQSPRDAQKGGQGSIGNQQQQGGTGGSGPNQQHQGTQPDKKTGYDKDQRPGQKP
jgi:hypothetical protein